MFVGHALLAFGLLALAARARGWPVERALALGVVGGVFATVPDVDMVYAPVGLVHALAAGGGVWAVTDGFWTASTVTHRTVTHSLVLGVPAAVAFALSPVRRRLSLGILAGIVALVGVLDGGLALVVASVFCLAGALVGALGTRLLDPRTTFVAALVGLLSHPFGDLFTGVPPAFLYPFDATLVSARVAPFGDPTLDLLLAFGVELAAIWFGVAAFARVTDQRLRAHVAPRAALGAGYAAAALVLTPPTMAGSYQFVFSVVAVGVVGAVPARFRRFPDPLTAVVTGLAAVTVAGVAYLVAYLVLGP